MLPPTDEFDPVTRMPSHQPVHNYDPINWDIFFDELSYLPNGTSLFRAGSQNVLFFCIHGAGHSAMSFATLAREIKKFGTLIAFDLKGHGHSKCTASLQDMSIDSLCAETVAVLTQVMDKYPQKTVILVGHSLGGAIGIRVAQAVAENDRIKGCLIIDVVEGTALEALPFMNQIINDRPQKFQSLQAGIKWAHTHGIVRKLESAKVSIPAQLVQLPDHHYGWKVDLKKTEKYWTGWFKGLSSAFLQLMVPKVLLTAEKERLDKELVIAQMQGKFKLVVMHGVGHSVQEDDFKGTALQCYELIRNFHIPMTAAEVAQKQEVGIATFKPHLPIVHF